MKKKYLIRIATICMAATLAVTPISVSAAALLKRGSTGSEVKLAQETLKELGYFTYPRATGYYGNITASAVKEFQKDYGITPDGVIGNRTRKALLDSVNSQETSDESSADKTASETSYKKVGALDWYKEVQYILKRGDVAEIMDVETEKTFYLKRTFGTNHADVEPLTKKDANIIKEIWGGWSWTRRAVVVKIDGYALAGSLAAMPHAGRDSKPAAAYVSGRSGGYGWGQNLDAVKNNGTDGVLDLHFKNSKTHSTNRVNEAHQVMVKKAAEYINKHY